MRIHKFPRPLWRRSDYLDRDSRSNTPRERITELVRDEERYYNSLSNHLNKIIIPEIPPQTITMDEITTQLLDLMKLKHNIENCSIDCSNHISFLSKKISDLRHVLPSELPGVNPNEVATLISRLKDFLALFYRLFGVSKAKVSIVSDNLKVMRSMEMRYKVLKRG